MIKKCYHDVCGGCLRLEERFYMDGNETKKTAYVCPVCIERGWLYPCWISLESIYILLAEKVRTLNFELNKCICAYTEMLSKLAL